MKTLYPEQLSDYLNSNGLPPLLSLFGSEPLLIDDAIRAVRTFCRQQNIDDYQRWTADASFDWGVISESQQAMSLFSSYSVIELHLADNKPGREGADALKQYCAQLPSDQCLIIVGSQLKREHRKAKWFTALADNGPTLMANTPERSKLPRFIHQRARAYQLQFDADAIERLADWYDGNLLGLDQELAKWQLSVAPGQVLSVDDVIRSSQDTSRYSVFDLQDSLNQRTLPETLHKLERILVEDDDIHRLLWLIQREVSLLAELQQAQQMQQDPQPLLRQHGIWSNQQGSYLQRAQNMPSAALTQALKLLQRLEMALKSQNGDDPKALLIHIITLLCEPQLSTNLAPFSESVEREGW